MRKNTHPYPTHQSANQKAGLPWETRTATEQQGSVEHACAHTNSREQSSPGTNARPRSRRRGVRLRLAGVCAHMCVCFPLASSQLSPCSARSPCVLLHVCVRISPRQVRFPSHHKTQNATTNKSLISSFLPQQHKAQPYP